jgi:hypothetical protein
MSKSEGNHQFELQDLFRHFIRGAEVLAERACLNQFVRALSGVLIFATLTFNAMAASGAVEAPSTFKYAGGDVPEWPAGAHEPPENGIYSVDWKYPVFSGENAARLASMAGLERLR